MAEVDPRVFARYQRPDFSEASRLFSPGFGELTRLRTWELFDRLLPAAPATVLDVGGGPGVHAQYLSSQGYAVRLLDPLERHVEEARARSDPDAGRFEASLGEARDLPVEDGSVDVVLLMGPLYHMPNPDDRAAALREARRALRPGGLLLAEIISCFAWLLESAHEDKFGEPRRWREFESNVTTGLSVPEELFGESSFWACFHRPEEAVAEVASAGFGGVEAYAVEGFVKHLPDLARRMSEDRDHVLRAARLVEREPSLMGSSPHVLIAATNDDN